MENCKFLKDISEPSDFRSFDIPMLLSLAEEVRNEILNIVSKIGGHLGASLGVVELTIALHYVFNTPEDLLIWDVGHQTYPHKILTGRKDLMHTIRQPGGLSGFTRRSESPYDVFGAGHTSTSISAALGLAVARDIENRTHEVIAVIGDGAMSAGMAYEAMNNAGSMKNRLIVILNDNKMSIAPAVGAMSKYLTRLLSSKPYFNIRNFAKNILQHLPSKMESFAKKTEKYAKDIATGGNLFSEMGFYYIGPIDGHDINQLVSVFHNIKSNSEIKSPILVHVMTEKGRGFNSPESSIESYHAVKPFNLTTKLQNKDANPKYTYTDVFSNTLIQLAENDEKIVAITAAMPSGTGLHKFAKRFSNRVFDVGIAEQHAVTFAAGLAIQGFKPFVAIYSTFLQRAYDQIIHDVAIQSLPVRFAIDRAGLVGPDGPTHAGSFDISYLINLPNFIIMAPSDEEELSKMLSTASIIQDKPCAIRYPRSEITGNDLPNNLDCIELGKARTIQSGKTVAIISLGTRLGDVIVTAKNIKEIFNLDITIVDARFAKPLDVKMFYDVLMRHDIFITIEEGSCGGFGAYLLHQLQIYHLSSQESQLNDATSSTSFDTKQCPLHSKIIYSMCLPDRFLDHNNIKQMYNEAELDHTAIFNKVSAMLKMVPLNA